MDTKNILNAWDGNPNCAECAIKAMVLFADLDQDDFNLIHQPIHEMELEVGDTLYAEEEKSNEIYTIRSGLIKLVRYLPDGSFRIVRLLKQGDVAGLEVLDNKPYLHHAIALEKTVLCQIPAKEIENINQRSPRLYKQLNMRWQRVMTDADLWISKFTSGFARERVINLLLYLADDGKKDRSYLPRREDMGAIVSITTETASRIIAELKREGLIRVLESHSVELEVERLKQLVSSN